VKRFCANDSADSRVKVGHCQAIIRKAPVKLTGAFRLSIFENLATFSSIHLAAADLRLGAAVCDWEE
jgi:hypothetical protein